MQALLICLVGLTACNNPQPYATDEQVSAVRFVSDEPPSLTLFTMINNTSGAGAHTSLLINASERVLFDPAGNFYLQNLPERNDVLFGFSDPVLQAYISSNARKEIHVWQQTIEVTPEVAETAYRLALSNGRVAAAMCTQSTARLLQQLPGFESIRPVFQPDNLGLQFEAIPGVVGERIYEDDDVTYSEAVAATNAALIEQ